MIREVVGGIFKIEIPLPKNPLKYINSYVVVSKGDILVIDTGLNNEMSKRVFDKGLEEIGVKRNNISFFITHMHADHAGLLCEVSDGSSYLYFSREDEPFIMGSDLMWDDFWEKTRLFGVEYGFPEDLSYSAIAHHPGYLFSVKKKPKGKVVNVKDGDEIRVGDYLFECIFTPGHTQGHVCLYERRHRILFSGDHVLYDITPNISAGVENPNPMGMYLKSLDRIKNLEVSIVLPGHRRVFSDLNLRVGQIKEHHHKRLSEVIEILRDAPRSAYEVAALMSWDIDCNSFDKYPVAQKWFATTEAVSHLIYLEEIGVVRSFRKDGVYIFELITDRPHQAFF